MNEPSASQPFPLPPYGDQQLQAPPFAPSHAGAPPCCSSRRPAGRTRTPRPPTDGFTTPISTVDAVPCTSPHTHQVVAKIAYQSSDNYVDVRDKRVHTDCAVALAEKVEKKILADDTYGQMFLLPADITAWKQWPAAACVVTTEQPTTGSLLKS